MKSSTIDWLNSLPKPGDTDGWNRRAAEVFAPILDKELARIMAGLAKPQPILKGNTDIHDAEGE